FQSATLYCSNSCRLTRSNPPRCAPPFHSLRSPPTSTLFPYTTLFRSSKHEHDRMLAKGIGEDVAADALELAVDHRPLQEAPCFEDRKSTRLNSSHQIIS